MKLYLINLEYIYIYLMYMFVFILGIIIGSFLNVCIYRIPNTISIVYGRSQCPKCKHQLNFLDLMPLFSYLLLKGKCKYCDTKISPRYFFVELLTGILFTLIYRIHGYTILTILHFIFTSVLIVIAYIDYDTMDIYDYNHYLIFLLGILRYLLVHDISLQEQLLGAILLTIPLLVLYYITKDGIGGGDVKLIASCGFYIGIPHIIVSFFISTISACIFVILLVLIKKKNRKDQIPFGPFLCSGFIIAILF